MITVGMNYEVLEGKNEPFEKKFAKVLEAMEQMEGHTTTNLYRAVFHKNSYVILSEWNSEEAFNNFIKSDAFKKTTDWGKETILAGRPKHEIYRPGGSMGSSKAEGCPAH